MCTNLDWKVDSGFPAGGESVISMLVMFSTDRSSLTACSRVVTTFSVPASWLPKTAQPCGTDRAGSGPRVLALAKVLTSGELLWGRGAGSVQPAVLASTPAWSTAPTLGGPGVSALPGRSARGESALHRPSQGSAGRGLPPAVAPGSARGPAVSESVLGAEARSSHPRVLRQRCCISIP